LRTGAPPAPPASESRFVEDRLVLLDAPALFESLPAHPLGDPKPGCRAVPGDGGVQHHHPQLRWAMGVTIPG